MIKEAIAKIKKKENLSDKEMTEVFTEIMTGRAGTDLIAEFLISLKEKGETVQEITGAARVMREFSEKINIKNKKVIDTCGTGGDASGTFNISTVSAFVAAGAGCRVAKHGNRSVSSRCGSADLLEALGVNINSSKEKVARCIDEIGIGFLFAPLMHSSMKYAMPARQKIKTRSIFNILGPLTNPADAKLQIMGVYDSDLVEIIAEVLQKLGAERAMVVHGTDGLDEITITSNNKISEIKDGTIETYTLKPEFFALGTAKKNDLKGGSPEENKKIAEAILKGEKGPKRNVVLANAACAIYVFGIAKDLKSAVSVAASSIDSGKAMDMLERLKKETNKQ